MNSLTSVWEAPSNIALVKYWGKRAVQIPQNPSVSLTLNNCKTKVKVTVNESDALEIIFNGERVHPFLEKFQEFIEMISPFLPWVSNSQFDIQSENTFPHSSGIASSASSYAAFACALTDLHIQKGHQIDDFNIFSSRLARLGSGSACRSIYDGFASWGQGDVLEYALAVQKIHDEFQNLRDAVLIISSEKKSISSTVGHSLMIDHPLAESRYAQARENTKALLDILKNGNWQEFIPLVEEEAFTLHALMKSSTPSYSLLKDQTIEVIEMIQAKRMETNWKMAVTLDAGPNIHLLYSHEEKWQINEWIQNEISPLVEKVIFDGRGTGPRRIS